MSLITSMCCLSNAVDNPYNERMEKKNTPQPPTSLRNIAVANEMCQWPSATVADRPNRMCRRMKTVAKAHTTFTYSSALLPTAAIVDDCMSIITSMMILSMMTIE